MTTTSRSPSSARRRLCAGLATMLVTGGLVLSAPAAFAGDRLGGIGVPRTLPLPTRGDTVDLTAPTLPGRPGVGKDAADPLIPDVTWPTFGPILEKWKADVGMFTLGGALLPEKPTADGQGYVQEFEHGTIIWHVATGAHTVTGPIRARWYELGGDRWGVPFTDVSTLGGGQYLHLKQLQVPGVPDASIYWSPATGAHEVVSDIRGFWASTGWEAGELGYPLDAQRPRNGGVPGLQQRFEGGTVVWTVEDGAAISTGTIEIDVYPITFGDGVPINGWAHLTLHPDGGYVYRGHFHVSGAPSYNVNNVIGVKTGSDRILWFSTAGRVHGTFEPGSRDYDWEISGQSNELAARWPGLSRGYTWKSRSGADVEIKDLVNDIKEGAGTIAVIVGALA